MKSEFVRRIDALEKHTAVCTCGSRSVFVIKQSDEETRAQVRARAGSRPACAVHGKGITVLIRSLPAEALEDGQAWPRRVRGGEKAPA